MDCSENIRVAIRFRPVNDRERRVSGKVLEEHDAGDDVLPWSWNSRSVLPLFLVSRGERARGATDHLQPHHAASTQFVYDRVFGAEDDNATLYEEMMRDLVISAMNGMHCAALAFGPTSSGKTFTMQGTSKHPGAIPRAVHDIFEFIEHNKEREFLLRVSYIEVYNESINDLFESASTNLKIFEDKKEGPKVQNLTEKIVISPDQVFALISAGEAQRKVGCTDYNKQSSRSHTILRIVIESRAKSESMTGKPARVAALNLVDLAGSESAQNIQDRARRHEGSSINKSLLTLTNIIYKLSDGIQRTSHIPYRDSKLTRILQNSLQGNSRISIICTCTPWDGAKDETLSTLRFALRAKKVTNKVEVNEILDERALLLQYKKEIAILKQKLADAEKAKSRASDKGDIQQQQQEEEEMETLNERLRTQIDAAIANLNRVILNSGLQSLETTSGSVSGKEDEDEDEGGSDGTPSPFRKKNEPFFKRLSSVDRDLSKQVEKLRLERSRSVSQSSVMDEDEEDGRATSLKRSHASREAPPIPPGPSNDSPPKTPVKRHSITTELRNIREQLANLLEQAAASASTPKSKDLIKSPNGGPPEPGIDTNYRYVKELERRVEDLEKQVQKYALEQSVSKADRSFLEKLLREKNKTIADWGEVISDIEKKQEALENENNWLREKLKQLQQT